MAASAAPENDNTPAETDVQAESSSEEVADSADKENESVAGTTSPSEQESVADELASPEHVESTEVPFVSPLTQETTETTDNSAAAEISATHEEPAHEMLPESEAVARTDSAPIEMSTNPTNPTNEPASEQEQVVEPAASVTASEETQSESAEPVAEHKEEVAENIPEPQTPEAVTEQAAQPEVEATQAESEAAQPVQEMLPAAAAVEEKTGAQELPIADTTFPYVEGSGLINAAKAEEVRPFTDFIAEFRQAEAALQATLRDSQVEALSILGSVASNLVQEGNQPAVAETSETSTEEADTAASQSEPTFVADQKPAEQSEEKSEAVRSEEEPKPVTRPVSPLLRPASRLRLPRHSFGRHAREEQQTPAAEETTTPVAKADVPAEAAPEAAAPRPARRYRFDRPAASTASSNVHAPARPGALSRTSAPAPAQPVQPVQPAQPKAEEKPAVNVQRTDEQATNAVQTPEPQTTGHKKHNNNNGSSTGTQETETTPVIQPAETHGRRRHSQKEQPAVVNEPVVETPAMEQTASSKEDVAPEDLPPLEYSELQKASSRRRRRHRSGSSNTGSHTTPSSAHVSEDVHVPPAPISAPAPMPAQPARTPAAVDNSDNNQSYTIVSGYTVSQMNQGNDVTGPFMAPEPSPARGSVMSRDGRNTRAEARPSATPSLYPTTRSADNGFSAAAMNQFGNVVSQALQTQTDRMVTEFRRISQAPTNVSVTLPPFPSTERVGVFVDVANLLYSARTLRMGVDFGKLLDFLRGNRRLIRAHAYCPTSPQAGDEQMFLQAVKGLGYRITTKNYKTFSSGAKKADLDLDLCMDVVRLVDGGAVDCIVLVSGDSDFMPMLDYCSDHGVRVEVAAFDEAMSATLRQSCDLFINLSMLEEIRV